MKRMLYVILLTVILMNLFTPVIYAATGSGQQTVAVYDVPDKDIVNEIYGNYNLISALRMTFPDICFIQNQQTINDVLEGKRQNFFVNDTIQGLRYDYAVKLYLLGPQLMVYNNEFYKLGIINPYLEKVIESVKEKPTDGKLYFLEMLQQYYQDMGILRPIMF